MTDNAQLIAIAGAAAAALVTEMVKETWSSTRALTARIFRYSGKEEEERQLDRLDSDKENLENLDSTKIEDRWQRRLLTLVEDHPEAAKELAELASRRPQGENDGLVQNVTGNTGSVIQVGRDNFGGINTEGR